MDSQNETPAELIEAFAPAQDASSAEQAPMNSPGVDADVVEAVQKVNARRVKSERKPRARRAATAGAAPTIAPETAEAAQAPQIEKENVMNFDATNWMNNFASVPGAERFQSLFAEAGNRGQQAVERTRTVAENFAELTRANVEALVETGRIAAAGAQTLGQEAVERARENFEQAATQTKSLTEASSPTEFFQLQGEIVRTQFDRMVAEGSRMTESLVKLTGEAIQPLSSRAALNAEKLNNLSA